MKSRKFLTLVIAFLSSLAAQNAIAQIQENSLSLFQNAHPSIQLYEQDQRVSMIYGTQFSTGQSPLHSAWNHVNQWKTLYGNDIGILVPKENASGEVIQGVMPNQNTGEYKFFTFRFEQTYAGLPVFRSGVGFLVRNEQDNPLVLTGFDVKEMNGFNVVQAGALQAQVTDAMLTSVQQLMDGDDTLKSDAAHSVLETPIEPAPVATPKLRGNERQARRAAKGRRAGGDRQKILQALRRKAIEVSDEELVIWAGINGIDEQPAIAVSFIAQRGSVRSYPNYDKFLILASAETGEILYSENQIHNLDVEGNVSGRATNGLATLECDPETAVGLPYVEVGISGGNSVYADVNGDFTIPHSGTGNVVVNSPLRGRWFTVFDQAAGDTTPSLSDTVTPPGPAEFLHNPNENQDLSTANVNAYYESNFVRDFVLSYEPSFPTIFNQEEFTINTNIDDSCNAYYDGSSINFFQAGGGCNNTSFSDVIWHEYGHHLVNVTGNGQGQFGEGASDCLGVLLDDEPILGNGFQGNCSTGIRTADNSKQYPCSGGIHDCGQLISGCVWDTLNELRTTEPDDFQEISSALFLGMLIVRGQTQPGATTIDPSITVIYLELDDDDSDIGNGTPHYFEIATGFGAHNMDAPDLNLVEFSFPQGLPELISPMGGFAFNVEITDLMETHDPATATLHVDRGNGFEMFELTPVTSGVFEANFPTTQCATEIKYYLSVDTLEGNSQSSPSGAPTEFYTALSADAVTVMFEDDFETNKGWTISGDVTDGEWDRATPTGGGDRGDPPNDADGSGICYLTDSADGNSDVDGGSTTLTSPTIDAINTGPVMVSYSRWYSNTFGNAPEADEFVVEVSNDNGATWTNLETVGPDGSEVSGGWYTKSFNISDTIEPTNQMRFRFTASDLGDGSVVEAGLDAFRIIKVHCSKLVLADSLNLASGSILEGNIEDLDYSDNQSMLLRTQARKGLTAFLDGSSPSENPSAIEFTMEAHALTGRRLLVQEIALYNYATADFEVIRSARMDVNEDDSVVIQLSGDLSRFIEPDTGKMEARLVHLPAPRKSWQPPVGNKNMVWDHFSWKVEY